MADAPLTIRTLTAGEIPDLVALVYAAFLTEPSPVRAAWEAALLEPERTHGVFDGGRLIGGGGVLSKRMTLPGGVSEPAAAVTTVGVAADHRRRGALTQLMRSQLHGLHEAGAEPFASLFAAEGGIYGRFGYGLAASRLEASLPRGAGFLPSVDVGTDRVREVDQDTAMPVMNELHRRVSARRTGWVSRTPAAWTMYVGDDPDELRRTNQTPARFVLHPDGYAIYRAEPKWGDRGPEAVLHVREIVATTAVAHAALWRYLLDVDLVGRVNCPGMAVDEPILHMLADPYHLSRDLRASLWVRIVDVNRALRLRGYSAPLDVVLAVEDEFCPWNAGRWRLVADTNGVAEVKRTTAEPDLALTASELGAIYLGGTTVGMLADAHRIRELRPGAVLAASRAFAGDHQPHCPEVF
ncbi:MAG: GNAT family N-acetyltransferase [Kutzneria sp.]|nr:GNAT family N-acetyltransferase [Kutzneria sp.]MBV9846483.1 GNAT family N-acetyltransferase [Kutzneria sp.]